MSSTPNYAPETINIHVRGASRKRFAINGDPNKVIELNTSDLGIVERLRDTLPKLKELEGRINKIQEAADKMSKTEDYESEETDNFINELNKHDAEMKELINSIFDEDVADKCSAGGTMYDPVGGEMRYMVIIDDLSAAYNGDLAKEMKAVSKKREQHTGKYTQKKR